MPRVYGITLPAGIEIIYSKTLKMYDITVNCNVGKNRRFVSREMKYNLKQFSKLYDVAFAWSFFNQTQKDAWYTAAQAIDVNGYSLYTQDKIYRIMNSIPGNATPSTYHQYLVGRLNIDAPEDHAVVTQYHVTAISLPATLAVSYKTNFTAVGPNPSVRFILRTLRYSGGKNITEEAEMTIPLVQDWDRQTIMVDPKQGTMGEWSIEIQAVDVIGELLFDNVFVNFDGDVRSWDPLCDDVTQYWIPTDVSPDVTFESIYPV